MLEQIGTEAAMQVKLTAHKTLKYSKDEKAKVVIE
tara:strand:- start:7464 stop:7568 length:105 start_codon:yes stop_codon:yes gene_type:complete